MSFDAVHDLQRAFRGLLEAFSFPGRRVDLSLSAEAIAPLLADPLGNTALGLAAAALIDHETSYFAEGALATFLVEWSGSKPVDVSGAAFVLLPRFGDAELCDLIDRARAGTLIDPHGGATLLVGVDDLDEGSACTLSGPGIESPREDILPSGQWRASRRDKVKEFPLGVDMAWFDRKHRVVALPRTTMLAGDS